MKSTICAATLFYILALFVFDELKHYVFASICVLIGLQIAILMLHLLFKKKEYLVLIALEITIFIGFFQTYRVVQEKRSLEKTVREHNLLKRKALFYGEVIDIPRITEGKTRLKIAIENFQLRNRKKQSFDAVIFLYIRGELAIHNHDRIAFRSSLREIKNFSADFDYITYCERQNVHYLAHLYSRRDIRFISHPHEKLLRFFDRKLAEQSAYLKTHDTTGIIKATILGDKNDLDESINDIFKRTGTAHLIVISGFHIAFLFFFISWILNKILFECGFYRLKIYYKKIGCVVTMIGLLLYLHLLNYPVPAARAFIFIVIYAISYLADIRISRISIIFFSAYVILLFDPQSLFGASFQLSFMCVLAIELLGLPLIGFAHRKKPHEFVEQSMSRVVIAKAARYYIDLLIISICISLCVLPLSLYYFHYINILNPLYNIIAIPIFSAVIALSFVFVLFFFFMPAVIQSLFINVIAGIDLFLYKLLSYGKDTFIWEVNTLPYELIVIFSIGFFVFAYLGPLQRQENH